MEINTVLTAILIFVFILVGGALVVLLLQLVKTLKSAQTLMTKLEPTLDNVETMTTDIQPAINKIEPMMDRVQLTIDSVNLEMMRVDEILEDITQITDSASNATAAVDTIASAPVKAVSNVTTRVRAKIGPKAASEESTELDEKISEVAKALEGYKAAREEVEPNLEGLEKIVADTQPIEDLAEAVEQAAEASEAKA